MKAVRTWQVELAVVAALLGLTVKLTGGGWVEMLGAAAVLAGFAHAQVADRLAESEAFRARGFDLMAGITLPSVVHCYRWQLRYLVGKEILWCGFFIAHRSWSALVGVGVFLLYPVWRRWYRQREPLGRASA